MNGKILLRTLGLNAIMQQGKYAGMKVGEVIRKSKSYLIWQYFNYSEYTFTDEVLDLLYIKQEDRIKKPGNNPELSQKYIKRNCLIAARQTAKEDNVFSTLRTMRMTQRARNKAHYKGLIERERIAFSKTSLQRKNQGHK